MSLVLLLLLIIVAPFTYAKNEGACPTLMVSLFGIAQCATLLTGSGSGIRLESVEKVIPGKTTKNELVSMAGKPNAERGSELEGSTWQYDGASGVRLVVTFQGDLVNSIHWNILNEDGPADLEAIKKRYPKMKWRARADESATPHYIPDRCYLEDDGAGIAIGFIPSTQSATSISWWNRSRRPSTHLRTSKKRSCIGDNCSEYFDSQLDEFCRQR